MIAFLRAFTWLRWRLLLGTLRGGSRRDALERLSRILAVVVPVMLLIAVIATALGLGGAALGAGWAVGSGGLAADPVLIAVRSVLFVVLAVVFLGALSGPGQGSLTVSTRLRTLPISDRMLHRVEALSALLDPWLVYVVPALLLLPLGLVLGGRRTASIAALAAGLALLAVMATLASATAQLARWFLRNRRRAETFTVLFVLTLSSLSIAPALLSERVEIKLRQKERVTSLPRWTRGVPSELYGHALRGALKERPRATWLPVGVLLGQSLLLYGVSAAAHRRVMASAETGSPRGATASPSAAARRLPFLSPATSAVAMAQVRTALRTVRGRVIVLTPAPLVLVFGILSRRMPDEFPAALGDGPLLLGAAAIFGLYALQAFTMNQFGADRSGLTMQFLAPISDAQLVRGKAVGCGIVFAATLSLALLCALTVSPGGSPLTWASVLLGSAATYALQAPFAAFLSALLPVASDLTKTGSGGNPHGLAMLAGTVLVLVLSAPAAAILLLVDRAMGQPLLGLALMAVWTALSLAASVLLLSVAARTVGPRRENLGLVAAGR